MNILRKLKLRKIERQVDKIPDFYAEKRTVTDSTATTINITEAEDG